MSGKVLAFNEQLNIWTNDDLAANVAEHICANFADRVGPGGVYLRDANKQAGLMTKIAQKAPLANDFVNGAFDRTKGLMAFTNGFMDMSKYEFHGDVNGNETRDKGFLTAVDDAYRKAPQKHVDYVRRVLFENGISDKAVSEYLLRVMATSLAGEADRHIHFVLGPTKSGKSLLTLALMNAFRGLSGTFQATTLTSKDTADEALSFKWVAALENKRLAVSNECRMVNDQGSGRVTFTTNLIKTICSGRTDRLKIRNLYEKIREINVDFIIVLFANDLPPFSNGDDVALRDRVVVMRMDRMAVKTVQNPNTQFQEDTSLKGKIDQPWFKDALRDLVFQSYLKWCAAGRNFDPPKEVQQPTQDYWDNHYSPMEQFFIRYEVWDQETRETFNKLGSRSMEKRQMTQQWVVRRTALKAMHREFKLTCTVNALEEELIRRGAERSYLRDPSEKGTSRANKKYPHIRGISRRHDADVAHMADGIMDLQPEPEDEYALEDECE